MTNRAKERGSAYERLVVAYLRSRGFDVERTYGAGRQDDRGDVRGLTDTVLELKDLQRIDLSTIVDEAKRERDNANVSLAVAVIKRRNRNVSESYVVLPLADFATLAKRAKL